MSCHNSLVYIKERSVGRAKYLIKHRRCNRWGRAETGDQTSKCYTHELLASFGKYFILPRFFAQLLCPDVSIWNFYLHGRSVENLRCFWRRIRHD